MRFRTFTLLVVLCGSLLAACGGGGGGGGSNADPVSATKLAISYIEQKKFDAIGDVVCAAQAASVQDSITGGAATAGVDVKKMLDAMAVKFENVVVTEVSRTGDNAVVSLTGTMKATVDKAKMKEALKDSAMAGGNVDLVVEGIAAAMAAGQPISTPDLAVVNEGGKWKVCGDITP